MTPIDLIESNVTQSHTRKTEEKKHQTNEL